MKVTRYQDQEKHPDVKHTAAENTCLMIPARLELWRQEVAVDAEDHQRRDADSQVIEIGDDGDH